MHTHVTETSSSYRCQTVFLNDYFNEEVYAKQPPSLINHKFPSHNFKLEKALCDVKRTFHAWFDKLSMYLLKYTFIKGVVDNTLLSCKLTKNILIVQN